MTHPFPTRRSSDLTKTAGKPISGLETIDQQIGYFDTLPEASQIAFLNAVVKDIDTLGPTLDTLVDQWSTGDPDAHAATMTESMEAPTDPAKTQLFHRHAHWAGQRTVRTIAAW